MSKLGLGTVQFGLDYGVSNGSGKTPAGEVTAMLAFAAGSGLDCLDTAPAYAESEAVLGQSLPRPHRFEVTTKTLPDAAISGSLARSLERLREPSVYGLLEHDVDALTPQRFDELRRAKDGGLVKKIGASVYTGAQIDRLLERFPIDLVQLPINLLDQRLLSSGHLDRLKERGVEIHARSAFLQGLIFLEPASLPAHFDSARGHLGRVRELVRASGHTMLSAALGFVLQLPQIDRVIVGATSKTELEQIVSAAIDGRPLPDATALAWSDPNILDPSRWPPR